MQPVPLPQTMCRDVFMIQRVAKLVTKNPDISVHEAVAIASREYGDLHPPYQPMLAPEDC